MHFHLLQHSPHQGPARIADWLTSMGHSHTVFHIDAGETPAHLADCDALIVLDGPMGIDNDTDYPWLRRERKLVDRAVSSTKPVLGIGFGARLIASALDATVGAGTRAEIGWHRVNLAPQSPFDLPECFEAFMWHRDVFSLPEGSLPLGGSATSPIQGFAWDGGRVVGLLCHLEVTPDSVTRLVGQLPASNGSGFGPDAQTLASMLEDPKRFDLLAPLLDRLLSQWLRQAIR